MDRRLLLATQGGTPSDYLLNIPFQNSINDLSGNYTMIPGNGSTNAPTFVSGRKGTDYCAYFDGTKSIKTNTNFVTGTDKISLSAWLRFSERPSGAIIVELGNQAPTSANSLFDLVLIGNQLTFRAKGNGQWYPIGFTNWYHIVVTADLSLSGELEINYYVNGVLYIDNKTNIDQSGNFANAVLHIGQRGGTTQGFKGYIQDLQVYNRVLSAGETLRIFKKQK